MTTAFNLVCSFGKIRSSHRFALLSMVKAANRAQASAAGPRWSVRYYDAALSRKGRGVQTRVFHDRAAAEKFAASNRVYGKPCKVEVAR